MVLEKLPATATLVLLGFAITVAASFPIGIATAKRAGGKLDRAITVFNQVCMSIPPVFVGILLCFVFGITLRVFVPGRFVTFGEDPGGFLLYMLFPALAVALSRIAMTVEDAPLLHPGRDGKGLHPHRLQPGLDRVDALKKHALRNAIIPVIAFLGVTAAELVAGSIVVEQVFAVPGLGQLLLSSIGSRDFPVAQAVVILLATWVVVVNFIADVLYQYMDPRIRIR